MGTIGEQVQCSQLTQVHLKAQEPVHLLRILSHAQM